MARGTSKAKNHKAKGEKKKKEDKLLPTVLDILVNLPTSEEVILKGISTDRILDVRKLLAANVETCHYTRYSLSHQVRGEHLSDAQEVVHLKPCVLTLVEEPYTEADAVDHVRRLLDLVASTACFGPSEKTVESGNEEAPQENRDVNAENLKEFADITRLCPPSKLGKFYEFFSFGHLKSPVQAIRKLSKQGCSEKDFFSLEVKVANGKLFTIVACSEGFYHAGRQHVKTHSLVDLLRHLSKAFDDAYEDLLKGFSERNKFANIPYNLRSNTWLVPPVAAENPSVFPPLPAEDETWGGNGGGQGRNPESLNKPWVRQFGVIAKMPCQTAEEREVRDHKAFVLHNYFVDVATTHAVALIKELDASRKLVQGGEHVETCGTLKFTISWDSTDPCKKVVWKIDSSSSSSQKESQAAVVERNLLKGITADESTVVHDTSTLSVVLVRHQGYRAVVEAAHTEAMTEDFDPSDPPEGGANALNANSLRTLLHKKTAKLESAADEENHAKELVRKVVEDGVAQMATQKRTFENQFIRWELGACWIQHLGEAKKDATEKKEKASKGPQTSKVTLPDEQVGDKQSPLNEVISKSSLERLKETGTGLHRKSVPELVREAEDYYNNVALPKLVSDFAALELSPVEGRTLTDFMHIRGLRISSLGHLAELCAKLPHIRSLCIHEMIIRAFKHLLRAVIALVKDTSDLASAIATTLNTIFGQMPTEDTDSTCMELPIWKWLELFVWSRFGWKLSYDSLLSLRKYAILRGLCYKVGIEMVPRDYDFSSTSPFSKTDVISVVPVYKHAICSSADGRTLLESSKAALDKGKLEDAVSFGSKALAKLIAVCGPYHRMTAGAYSLLAVVLYHTGDFVQAMIYQQKALDINERELGLDHPDTMKSYGDLAVFYYRLQHTELALRYVNRALYLLHLICGPSHPNTAATYINVAMMEEALGNAHVALRYLHEALKCNERLLGKDHIQTAASYHAIAIALSLMEAYSLSVHHEQTTFQILQAKLGADDIRTQDAAAWLEYFDSKAVEQQEAARTGAPKPDPSVASKGHLSVSDLLEFINAEVAASSDKENKRKRLKALLSKHGNRSMEEMASSVVGAMNAPDVAEVKVEKQPVDKESIGKTTKKVEQEQQIQKQEQPKEHGRQDTQLNEPRPAEYHGSQDDEEGWLEATSRGKHHKRVVAVRSQPHSYQRAGSMSRSSWKPINVPHSEAEESSAKVERAKVEVKKPETDVTAQEVPSAGGGAATHDQVRSYRDVAAQTKREPQRAPLETVSKVVETPAPPSEEGKSDNEAKTVENEDSTSQASSTAPSVTSKSQPGSPKAGKTNVQQRSKPAPAPALTQTKISTTVAVTPIRKQVQLPSHSSNATQACLTRGSAAAETTQASPSPTVAAAADASLTSPTAATTPGSKKPMNPFAPEFVPGRKWHPLVPSGIKVEASGTGTKEEGETTQGAIKEPVEQVTDVKLNSSDNDENRLEEEASTDKSSGANAKKENKLQQRLPAAKDTSGYYSSDSNCTSERSSTEDSTNEGALIAGMKKQRNNNKSRGQARWQRRSDGAITRVYRLQGDKSSANPQLRTTSTFTDVPEPHTLQPVSIMRRSVSVS